MLWYGQNATEKTCVFDVNRPYSSKGLFTPKTHVFSAAEILLRIYQNPMHLDGTRWRTRFWRQREIRRRKNVVRQRAPFKCMGF